MTNLFKKIAASIVGMAMAIGVGIGLSTNSVREARADNVTHTFTSKAWADSTSSWTSNNDGGQLSSGRGVQVTTGSTGAGATSKSSFTSISEIAFTYSTNASAGAGSISVTIGDNTAVQYSITKTGGTSDRTASHTYSTPQTGAVTFAVSCTTNSIYVKSIKITYGGGGGGQEETPTDTYGMSGKNWVIKAGSLYLKNDVSTSTKPTATSNKGDAAVFTFTLGSVTDTFTLASIDNSGYYLSSNTNTGDKVRLNATAMVWTLETDNNQKYLKNSYGNYLECYNSADWRVYASKTQASGALTFEEVTVSPSIASISITGTPASEMGCGAEFNLTGNVTTKFDPSSTLSTNVNWSVLPANAVSFSKNPSASGEQITITAGNSAVQNVVITATSVADNTKSASTSSFTIVKSYEITRVDLATSNGQTSFDANGASSVVVNLTTAIVYSGDAGAGALTLTSNPATHATLSAINNGAFTATFDHVGTYTIKSEAVENTSKYATVTLTITGIPYANSSGLTAGNYYIKANTNNYLTGVSGGEGTTSTSPAGALLFTFTLVDDNAWTIVNDGKYLKVGTSSTSLELVETQQTLIVSTGGASGTFKIGNGSRSLAWYADGSSIRTYATATDLVLEIDDGKTSVPLAVAQSSVSMEVGDNDFAPTVTRTDTSATVSDYTLTSSNTDAVTIVDNKVHALASGSSTITVSKEATVSEKYVSVTFTVSVTHTSSIEDVVKECADLGRNETAEGTYTIQGTITGVYGNSYVIQQGNYGMLIYNHAVTGAATGKVLRVEGTFGKYNGRIESRTINSAELVDTTPEIIHPLLVTNPSTLTNEDQNRLMTFTGLTYDSVNSATYSSSSDVSIYFKIDDTHSVTYRTNRYVSADAHTALAAKMNQVIAAAANEETEGATFNLVNVHYCIYTDSNNVSSQQFNIDDADKIQIIPNSLTKEEKVQKFIDDYMHFDDIEDNETTRNSSGTACSGVNGYYQKAKSALLALGEECVSLFQSDDTFNAAQERYESWAVINQDLSPYTEDTQSTNTIYGTQNNNNVSIIIVVISMLSITALGGFFFLRKRKEEK